MKSELLGVCFDRYMYRNLETILLILSHDFFTLQTMYTRVPHSFHFDFLLGRQKKLELRVPSYVFFFHVLTMWTHGSGSRNNSLDTFLGAV